MPHFQKESVWQKSKRSFETLRTRSLEMITGICGHNPTNKRKVSLVLKHYPCYQSKPHFYIDTLNFTAVEAPGGFLLFRPMRCQLCKEQGHGTRTLSRAKVDDYREKENHRNSLQSMGSGAVNIRHQRNREYVICQSESTEMSRTTKRSVHAGCQKRNRNKWKGRGSSLLQSMMKKVFG